MPIFKYRVRDRSGNAAVGTIDAPNVQLAGDQLHALGYFPISIEKAEQAASLDLSDLWTRFQKVKLEELIVFSQQLSTLYKAGLPILLGLQSIAEQTKNKKFKKVLEEVHKQIESGSTLHGAMAKYPDVFSTIYVNMVRAGETSGMLGESLDRFVTLSERELRTRQRVKEATRYPKIVILSLAIAFAVLVMFIIPRFAQVFAQFKTPLPLPTRIMIGINDLFQHYWYVLLAVGIGVPILLKRYLNTENGRYLWDSFKMRIPVFGPLFLKIALSRFTFIFVMLNRSGIPILDTLEITSTTINNVRISKAIEEIRQYVRQGKSLTDSMRETQMFTPLVIQMVSVGESSGTLDSMLTRVTEYYDIEADNTIKKLSTYIEPFLTLFLGVAVLFLALAVFLPWWNLVKIFK
ncbi:MAG: type II secretion system F family protein [Syntrophaceae bacterium]|nr:type II secretion system F family protein [Syntrophaceae bacterium]